MVVVRERAAGCPRSRLVAAERERAAVGPFEVVAARARAAAAK